MELLRVQLNDCGDPLTPEDYERGWYWADGLVATKRLIQGWVEPVRNKTVGRPKDENSDKE